MRTQNASVAAGSSSQPLLCPQCEREYLTTRRCRTVCEECGYVESCEDNFLPTRATPKRERQPH